MFTSITHYDREMAVDYLATMRGMLEDHGWSAMAEWIMSGQHPLADGLGPGACGGGSLNAVSRVMNLRCAGMPPMCNARLRVAVEPSTYLRGHSLAQHGGA